MNIEKINDFWVPSNDIHIEDWKAGKPFTQNKCLNRFLEYLRTTKQHMNTVIDVGAWCGTWSKAIEPFAKKVIAFEPDSVHFECLQRNCVVNCDARMEAVGSELKQISLTEDNFTQAKRIDKQGNINMTTLDKLQIKDVDMIKIDVEGLDHEVIKGMKKLLAKYRPVILVEYNFSNFKIIYNLVKINYKCYQFDMDQNKLKKLSDKEINLLISGKTLEKKYSKNSVNIFYIHKNNQFNLKK